MGEPHQRAVSWTSLGEIGPTVPWAPS